MTMYIPEMWKVIEITTSKGEVIRKVFGGWRSSYLTGNHWRLNSGIESEDFDGDIYSFIGSSGSIYKCHKNLEGIQGMFLEAEFENIIKSYIDRGCKVEVIEYSQQEKEE
jgi:hypothetical protein